MPSFETRIESAAIALAIRHLGQCWTVTDAADFIDRHCEWFSVALRGRLLGALAALDLNFPLERKHEESYGGVGAVFVGQNVYDLRNQLEAKVPLNPRVKTFHRGLLPALQHDMREGYSLLSLQTENILDDGTLAAYRAALGLNIPAGTKPHRTYMAYTIERLVAYHFPRGTNFDRVAHLQAGRYRFNLIEVQNYCIGTFEYLDGDLVRFDTPAGDGTLTLSIEDWQQALAFLVAHARLDPQLANGNVTAQEFIAAVLNALDPPLEERVRLSKAKRRQRKRKFRDLVLKAYGNACAICGMAVVDKDGKPLVEAAHTHSGAHQWCQDPRGGMALCPNHHKAYDHGLIALNDDWEVIIHPRVPRTAENRDLLLRYEFQKIRLPAEASLWPHCKFLQAHRDQHGFPPEAETTDDGEISGEGIA